MAAILSKKIIICIILLSVFQMGCGLKPKEKPISPRLIFTEGSAFLANAHSLALRGDIEFNDGKSLQSGKFTLFINGLDSLALLIEGPLNVDVLRMVVLGQTTYIRSKDEKDWQTIERGETIEIESYGIDNISPASTGVYAFPQFYLHPIGDEIAPSQYKFSRDSEDYFIIQRQDQNGFFVTTRNSNILAYYNRQHNIEGGYYPSIVRIYDAGKSWKISLSIKKLKLNPSIPDNIWFRD